MRLFALSLFAVLTSDTSGFFYSESSTRQSDCTWLPWKYIACIRSGNDFRKLENRTKISLYGTQSCSSETESRTIKSCTAAEFIASTVLSTISNRLRTDILLVSAEDSCVVCRPSLDAVWSTMTTPFTTTTTTTPFTTTSEPRHCANTFTDRVTGIKMLGADCGRRFRRSVDETAAKSRQKRQFSNGGVVSAKHRDILFLLDESASVGKANFEKELEFVKVIAEKLDTPRQIGRDATRVALTTFSANYAHRIEFLDSPNVREFKDALKSVSYRSKHDSSTCLIDALRAARDEVFKWVAGSRVPLEADGLVILITDGCLNCKGGDVRSLLQREQELFEEWDISILTFMINVRGRCERSFKALQDGSSCFQGYSYPSWAEFDNMIKMFRRMDGRINHWTKNSDDCP